MAYFDLNPLLVKMLDVAPGVSDLNLSVGIHLRSRSMGSSKVFLTLGLRSSRHTRPRSLS